MATGTLCLATFTHWASIVQYNGQVLHDACDSLCAAFPDNFFFFLVRDSFFEKKKAWAHAQSTVNARNFCRCLICLCGGPPTQEVGGKALSLHLTMFVDFQLASGSQSNYH